MQNDDSPSPKPMQPLHPNLVWVLRLRGLIIFLPLVIAAAMVDLALSPRLAVPSGLLVGAVLLVALAAIVLLPRRRYRAWAYREVEDELHIRSGLMFRLDTIVPFGRVQHIDVAHGPLERRFGLATLILHTAGTRSAAVPLPGLTHAEAEAMRDRIRVKLRQDLV